MMQGEEILEWVPASHLVAGDVVKFSEPVVTQTSHGKQNLKGWRHVVAHIDEVQIFGMPERPFKHRFIMTAMPGCDGYVPHQHGERVIRRGRIVYSPKTRRAVCSNHRRFEEIRREQVWITYGVKI